MMIPDLKELSYYVGAVREDAKSIARRLYKDTVCGIGFETVPGGVEIAGYAEGSDVELPNHRLLFPFTSEEWDAAVKLADEEGCAEWDEANTCPVCEGEGEIYDNHGDITGQSTTAEACPECGGEG